MILCKDFFSFKSIASEQVKRSCLPYIDCTMLGLYYVWILLFLSCLITHRQGQFREFKLIVAPLLVLVESLCVSFIHCIPFIVVHLMSNSIY